jgi:hypothetical protein
MMDLKEKSNRFLLNNIWECGNGMCPTGPWGEEENLKELVRRDPNMKLYHSEQTVSERLAEVLQRNKRRW